MGRAKLDLKWIVDLLLKRKKQNAADHQFLQNNGAGYKLLDKFLHIIGNGFKGGDGWNTK